MPTTTNPNHSLPETMRTNDRMATPSKSFGKNRNIALDIARFVAALAVIWIHACRSETLSSTSSLARFAVPFFTAAAAWSMARSFAKQQPSWFQFALKRMERLYVPFLLWSIAYILFKIGKRALLPDQDCDLPGIEMLWQGGAYHLWFIPFVIVASLALFPIADWVAGDATRPFPAALCALTVGILIGLFAPMDDGSGAFWILAIQASPSFLWGLAFAWCSMASASTDAARPSNGTSFQLNGMLLTLLFAASLLSQPFGSRETLLENGAGCCLLLFAVAGIQSSPTSRWPLTSLAYLGQISFGIYFGHLMILKVGEAIARKLHFEVSPGLDFGLFILTAMLSGVLAHLCAKSNWSRWMVA